MKIFHFPKTKNFSSQGRQSRSHQENIRNYWIGIAKKYIGSTMFTPL